MFPHLFFCLLLFVPTVIHLGLREEDLQTRGKLDHFLAYYGLIIL